MRIRLRSPRAALRPASLLVAGMALGGCAGGHSSPPIAPAASSVPTVSPVPPSSQVSAQQGAGQSAAARPGLENLAVRRALQQMATLRELPAKNDVLAQIIGREQMVDRVKQQLRREVPPGVVEATSKMLYGFGVVGANFDLERSLLDLMSAELAGFYEPADKTLYLLEDLVGPEREATLSHELVHALQDQHYNLSKLIAYREDGSDEQTAVHALAEGDATSAMMDAMLAPRGLHATDASDDLIALQARGVMEANPRAASVPAVMRRSILSSYTDGLPFVHWLRRHGGWAAVNNAWQSPPQTTEQLLHPEKFLAREPGLTVAVPSAPPAGPTQLAYRDVQGEQSVRLLLEEWVPAKTAAEAAAGWGGDRLAVFSDGSLSAVAWHIRYDDEALARRALVSFARGVLRPEEAVANVRVSPVARVDAEKALKHDGVCRKRAQRGNFAALRHAAEIVLIAGPFRISDGVAPNQDCRMTLAWAAEIAKQ